MNDYRFVEAEYKELGEKMDRLHAKMKSFVRWYTISALSVIAVLVALIVIFWRMAP